MSRAITPTRERPGKWGTRAGAAAIVAAHLILLLFTAREKSLTTDEPYHIARGVAAWRTGDFRLCVAHPPLANLITALPPVLLFDLDVPVDHPDWNNPLLHDADRKSRLATHLLAGNPDYLAIALAARVPTMILSAALALLIFGAAKKLYGPRAGLAALALYAFSPTALAHGCLATTDTAAALAFFLFAIALQRQIEKPGALNLALAGLAFGIAQLTKFTAILLVPLAPAAMILAGEGGLRERLRAFFRPGRIGSLAAIYLIGALTVWAGYGFETHGFHRIVPPAELAPLSSAGLLIKQLLVRAAAFLNLPPPTYFFGLTTTLLDTSQHGKPLYFMGRASESGWWWYYPVLFLIKEPLAFLAMIALAPAAPRPGCRPPRAIGAALGWGLVFFFIVFNAKNIGIRHLLPAYPFLMAWMSRAFAREARPALRLSAALLVALYFVNAFLARPDYLVHFNGLVGGPDGGLKMAVVGEDWGQDVAALGRWQRENRIAPLFYQPYGNADPAAYGVNFEKFDCHERPPGYYALHVVDLRRPTSLPAECLADFASLEPNTVLHHTIFIYHLEPGKNK